MFNDAKRFVWSFIAATAALFLSIGGVRLATGASVDDLIHHAHSIWHIAALPMVGLGLPLVGWLDRRGMLNLWTLLGGSALAGFLTAAVLVLVMTPQWEKSPYAGLLPAVGGAATGVCSAFAGWLVWRLWPLPQSGKLSSYVPAAEPEVKPCPKPTIQKR